MFMKVIKQVYIYKYITKNSFPPYIKPMIN